MSSLIKIKITALLLEFFSPLKAIRIIKEHIREFWDVCTPDHGLQDRKGQMN